MTTLAECAPCKAKRLQEESEKEFRKRFGFVKLNGISWSPTWRPSMGQMNPAVSTPSTRTYLDQTKERLLWFGGSAAFGFPIGILVNVVFTGLRPYRKEAAMMAVLAAGVGLVASLLPVGESKIVDSIAKISGFFAGSSLADITLPKKGVVPTPA